MAGPSSHHRGLSAGVRPSLNGFFAAHIVPAAVYRYLDQHAVLGQGVEQEVLDDVAGEAETATRPGWYQRNIYIGRIVTKCAACAGAAGPTFATQP